MPNEITAEELAREMCKQRGLDPDSTTKTISPGWRYFADRADDHLFATRALASLQAERAKPLFGDLTVGLGKMPPILPKDAPERVRCWYSVSVNAITTCEHVADEWLADGLTVTECYFTTKRSSDD